MEIMENDNQMTLEEMVASIIDKHRQKAYRSIEDEMSQAYEEVADLVLKTGLRAIKGKKISGISTHTIKEIRGRKLEGKPIIPNEEHLHREYFIEFIKARTLTFESQRAKYSNFLKPWTEEDDLRLEELWCEGRSIDELSSIFRRHPNGITSRISKLQLEEKYG